MRNLIAILALCICSVANATDITIVDFSKSYEHHYQNCDVYFHNPDGYMYANCGSYAAPFITYQQSDWSSPLYDEIGINGVLWNNCNMVASATIEVRFECNTTRRSFTFNDDWLNRLIKPPFMFYEVVYNPYP